MLELCVASAVVYAFIKASITRGGCLLAATRMSARHVPTPIAH